MDGRAARRPFRSLAAQPSDAGQRGETPGKRRGPGDDSPKGLERFGGKFLISGENKYLSCKSGGGDGGGGGGALLGTSLNGFFHS